MAVNKSRHVIVSSHGTPLRANPVSRRTQRQWMLTAVAACASVFALATPAAKATVVYWDANTTTAGAGATPTGTWGTSNFWNTDSTGGAGGAFQTTTTNTDDLYFVAGPGAASGNNAYVVTVSGSQVANSLNFQASGATTLSGGTLITLGNGTSGSGGINIPQYAYGSTNNGAVTISTAVTLNNTQTWTNNSASLFTVSTGALTLGTNTLTIAGTGNTTISSAIAATAGSLTKTGAGTLTLTGANLYTGTTTINAGTLILDKTAGGTLATTTPLTFTGTGTFNYKANTSGSQTLGALTFSAGEGTVLNTFSATSSTLTFDSLAARTAGAVGNFSTSGGTVSTYHSAGSNKILLTTAPGTTDQLLDKGFYFNSNDYAVYDSTAGVGLRALNYASDTNAVSVGGGATIGAQTGKDVQVTGLITAQTNISVNTLQFSTATPTTFTITGGQTLTVNGLLRDSGGNTTIAGATGIIAIGAGNDLTIRSNVNNFNIDSIVTGAIGKVTVSADSSAHSVILTNANNTYGGGTVLDSGQLYINTSTTGTPGAVTKGPLGTGTLTIYGGRFHHALSTFTFSNDMDFRGDAILRTNDTLGSGTRTYDGTTTFSPGLGTLTIDTGAGGGGTLLLSGNLNINTDFTVTSTVTGNPTIVFGAAGKNITWSAARQITFTNTVTANIFRGTLVGTGGALTIAGTSPVTWGDGTAAISGNGTVIFNGPTVSAGTANTYTSGTTIAGGIFDWNSQNAGLGTGTITFAGGTIRTLAGNRTIANNLAVATGGLTFAGSVVDTYTGAASVNNNATLTFSETAGGKTFSGVWTLNADLTTAGVSTSTDVFSGGFTVGGGVASQNRTITMNGANSVSFGGTLSGTNTGQTITLAGTSTNNIIGNLTSGVNAPNIIINAASTAVFASNNASTAYTGQITLTSGIVSLNTGNPGPMFGGGTLVMNGGTVNNAGGTRVVNGLQSLVFDTGGGTFANSAGAQNSTFLAPITVQNSPTINFTNGIAGYFFSGAMTLNSGLTIGGTHTQAATFSGGLNAAGANRTITLNDTGTTVFSGTMSGSGNTLTLAGSSTGVQVGALGGSGTNLEINGTGTYTFNAASTGYSGSTTLTAGTMTVTASLALQNSTLVRNGGTLNWSGQTVYTLGGLSGSTNLSLLNVTPAAITLSVGTNNANTTYGGVLSGASGALTKIGTGTLTLTGANSYTGATTVSNGTLTVSGATGAITGSNVTVTSGALVLDNSGGTFISRLGDAKTISLGTLTLTSYNGAGAQTETTGIATFATPGKVTINNGTTAGDQTTLAFTGTMVRSTGAAIDFVGTNGTLGAGANSPNVTNSAVWAGITNGIIPWATVGGTAWAESNANSIRAYTGAFVDPTSAATNSTQNSQLSGVAGVSTIGSTKAFNSFNAITSASGQSLNLGTAFNLNLTSGAILKSGTDAYSITSTSTGTIGAGATGTGTELIVHVDGGDLSISAPLNTAIVNLAKGGTGKLILSGTRAASFTTVGLAGTLEMQGSTTAITGVISGPGALVANLTTGQTLTLSSSSSTFTGGVTLLNGTLSNGSTSTPATVTSAGLAPVSGPLGTGTLTISGGKFLFATGVNGQSISNAVTINGSATIETATAGNGLKAFTGTTTFAAGLTTLTVNDTNAFSGDSMGLTGNLNLNTDFTLAGSFLSNNSLSLGGSGSVISWSANRQVTLSNTFVTGTTVFRGVLSGGANTLTLAGTGILQLGDLTNAIPVSGVSGGLIVNGPTVSIPTANTFTGGVTLTSGVISYNIGSVGSGSATTSGPMGVGTLTLNGGILKAAATSTLGNSIVIGGSTTIENTPTTNNGIFTYSGPLALNSGAVITFTNTGGAGATGETRNFTGLTTFGADATLNLNSTVGTTIGWSGGFDLANATRTLTVNGTGNDTLTLSGVLQSTGGSSANQLTLAGSKNFSVGSVNAGANNPGITVNGSAVYTFSGAGTYSGGTTLTAGTLAVGASSTLVTSDAGVVTILSGPVGTGTLTVASGTLRSNSNTAFTLNNSVNFTGDATIGDLTNTGAITVDPTTRTTPGSITVTGARTLTMLSGATLTGPITGVSTPSLAIKGPGTLILINSSTTNSTMGAVAIGDNSASGSIGGNLSVQSQNAMGSGAYTINYGGTLSLSTNPINPTNAITVNNGGTFRVASGGTANQLLFASTTAATAFNSGSTFNQSGGATALATAGTGAGQVSFPAAGVLFLNSANSLTVTGKYPDLTGTLAIGGTQSGGTMSFSTATGITANRTLALNTAGGGSVTLGGINLSGGNLTVAGSGNGGFTGTIPQGSVSSLGTVSQTGTRSITVAMAPTGVVGFTAAATGYTGLTVTGGLVNFNAGNAAATDFGGSTVTLNGGGIRSTNAANNTGTVNDTINIGANGGILEAFSNGNSNIMVLTNLTGSGALTLRYGGSGTNTGSVFFTSTTASGYSGAITLATTNGRGRVQFNPNALSSVAAAGVTVPAGVAFSLDTYNNTVSNIGKFATSTGSILAYDNFAGTNVDLTSGGSGINRDLRIGNAGTVTLSGTQTLTPYSTTYNITPGANFVVNSINWLTGAGNSLDVRAGEIAPGAYNVTNPGANSLALNGSQNFGTSGGTVTVSGTINNSVIGTGTTSTTLNVSGGVLTYTGATSVTRGANMTVSALTGSISATSGVTVQGSATFQDGDGTTAASNNAITNRINSAATLTVGGTDGGGTFRMAFPAATFTHAQTLASLTVNPGSSSLTTTGTVAGTVNLAFTGTGGAGYVRNTGGVALVTSATGFNPSFTNAPTAGGGSSVASNSTTISGNTHGTITIDNITSTVGLVVGMPISGTDIPANSTIASIAANSITINNSATGTTTGVTATVKANPILVGLTYGSAATASDFVGAVAGNLAAVTYTAAPATGSDWGTNKGFGNLSATATTASIAAGTINSLKIANAFTSGGSLTLTGALNINSGMILFQNGNNATITGGSITTGGSDLVILSSAAGTPTLNSQINIGSAALTINANGSQSLTLGGTSNAFGDLYLYGGKAVVLNSASALPLTGTRTLNLFGGTLQFSSNGGTLANTSIAVSPVGGRIDVNNSTPTSFGGSVTLNGVLTLSAPSGGGATTTTFTGNISGAGQILIGKQSDGKDITVITGSNNSWTGGVRFDTGGNAAGGTSHLRFAPSTAGYNSSGTGPINIVNGNAPGGIYFDTTAAGSTTFSNDIINTFAQVPIIAWGLSNGFGTGTANTTTLSGKIVGNQGLIFQGYATGDNAVSELVLTGTVSVSGASGGYSYGTATLAQNFNNGQGGITLGTTGFKTLTAQTNTIVDLPVGTATNGAEGFVTFGNASTFIPGAAGPGYIAAIRKAGTANDGRFGYLVTSTTAGATFTLPEGKGFVIGSLGTGASVGGTLGVAGGDGSTSSSYTATLAGSPKLTGFAAGDVNIHANAASDTQSLNLLARASNDTLILGNAAPVVFTPTYGDSGNTSAITLMADRTGNTTLNKIGAGTVDVSNAAFTHVDGTDARSAFSLAVSAGTLKYSQNDGTASSFVGTAVTGGKLHVTGQLNSPVSITGGSITSGTTGTITGAVSVGGSPSAHTIAPGGLTTFGTLNLGSTLSVASTTTLDFDINGASQDLLAVTGAFSVASTTPTIALHTAGLSGNYVLATFASTAATLSDFNVTGLPGGYSLVVNPTNISLISGGGVATPTIAITAPTAGTRVMAGQALNVVAGTVGNTGTATLNVALTSTGTLSVTSLTPLSATVAAGTSTTFTGTLNTGAITGPRTFQVTETDGAASPTSVAASGSVTVLDNRVVSAGATVNLGVVHQGNALSGSFNLNSAGADNLFTRVTVSNAAADANNIATSGGSNPTFNGSTSDSRSIGGTPATAGIKTNSLTLTTNSTESLFGEAPINVSVSYTGQVFTGKAQWNGVAADGKWGTNTNWQDTLSAATAGAPGLDGGLSAGDTATFPAAGSPTAVALDTAAPSVAGIAFVGSNAYTVNQGSGSNSITLQNNANVTAAGTTHTIAAPVIAGAISNFNADVTGGLALTGGLTTPAAGQVNVNTSTVGTNTGSVSISGTQVYGAGTTLAVGAGSATLGAGGVTGSIASANVSTGATLNINNNNVFAAGASITNTGTVVTTGAVTLASGTSPSLAGPITDPAAGEIFGGTPASTAVSGVTTVSQNATLAVSRIRQDTLNIQGTAGNDAATVSIAPSAPAATSYAPGDNHYVSVVKSLNIDHSGTTYYGTLDLGNNDIIVDYTGLSPASQLEEAVRSGYNGGAWNGKGIIMNAAYATTGSYAIDIVDNATLGASSFDGIAIDADTVIIKFTWVADLNIDGFVTAADASVFGTNYSAGSATSRFFGDLNYNGSFDAGDASIFGTSYDASLPSLPEPATLGVLALGAIGLLARRRK